MDTVTTLPQALNERAAARYLGVSVLTLQSWRAHGEGPVYCKLGRAVRYRVEDLEGYLVSCRVEPRAAVA